MAKYDPNRSMLFWWMGDVDGGGDHYQVMVVKNNKVAVQIDSDTGEPFEWPESEIPAVKHNLKKDGWRVVEDAGGKRHFAALGDAHRHWTVKNLAWLVGRIVPDSGDAYTIGSKPKAE